MLGDCVRQQDTQAEFMQRLAALVPSHLLGGHHQAPWQQQQLQQQQDTFPASTAEEVHAILRSLVPQALAVSPFLSLKGPNSLLFAFIFDGFLQSWQAWGLQPQHQQQQQETDAVMEVLAAQTSCARSSLLHLLSPLVSQSTCGAQRLGVGSSGSTECVSQQQLQQQGDTAELLVLQCWLFVCECGLHAFAAALSWGSKEALKQQVQQDGGCFFGLPYAALQRWQHLVAAAAAFLQTNTNPPHPLAGATLSSFLDYPEVLTALQQHCFPSALARWGPQDYPEVLTALQQHCFPSASAAAAAASVLSLGEAAAAEEEACSTSCIAIMLLYIIAKMHGIPYFREALHDCLPEKASLDFPFSPVSPSLLLQAATPHPAALLAADVADPLNRAIAASSCGTTATGTPVAAGAAAAAIAAAAAEADGEALQLFLTNEPLAGISAAICSLINFFFANEEDSSPDSSAPCGDFSPTADDVPADAAAAAAGTAAVIVGEDIADMGADTAAFLSLERSCVAPPRLSEALLDSYYLCVVQNPLKLLLQLPARILQQLLAANLLQPILNLLLFKLEVYARMGAPTLAGMAPPPIAAEEVIQLQVPIHLATTLHRNEARDNISPCLVTHANEYACIFRSC
ncbi:hypothetical protein, conserved [Eimeria praecox]|uniref:Uncharacterized protein n=1 Tax=Eimeria praecox TaxID=51316 RepID=U6GQI6_9EIME|nr:hypothetical protein, conserved [Eimeria praecox]